MRKALPNRIREFRKAQGLSLEELAFKVGEEVSITAISRLERGRMELTQRWLERIGAALGINPIELIGDAASEVRMIPILGAVPAGDLAEAIEDPRGWFPLPASAAGQRAYALEPEGDSMDLMLRDHEIIVVDPDQLDLISGRAYIVMDGAGQATFKRYHADPPRLEPDSSNPAHQPIMIGREPFVIKGRVVYAARAL